MPFTVSSMKMKYLGINLKHVQDLYAENDKILMKEIKDELKKWKDILSSRCNIVKMAIILKLSKIYIERCGP